MTNKTTVTRTLWQKMSRYSFMKRKISTKNLDRLCRENATDKLSLIIHSEDVDYEPYFPNAYAVTKRTEKPADMHVDLYYTELSKIPDESYEVIVCTGLLEHLPEPQLLIDDMKRILKPGGELVISASAVFSFHECPDDFYHFTPYSFKRMFEGWSEIKMLRGASQPFETLAILLQRILIQCDIFPPLRPLMEIGCIVLPWLDKLIISQFDKAWVFDEHHRIDSMLPSNMQAVVVK